MASPGLNETLFMFDIVIIILWIKDMIFDSILKYTFKRC